ncbi:MAG TPA: hypothetical protein VJ692_10375 [Nitrospiraceae bacterium]|nr:hypothetical protein [Nitrospiraceae bacterium]
MFDLTRFSLKDMTECGAAIRRLSLHAASFEQSAQKIVHYLYTQLTNPATGQPACALVRLFKTHRFENLDAELQRFAVQRVGYSPAPFTKCFTLMATAGDLPEWNDRTCSRRFKAIPISGDSFVAQFPMFSQLMTQFGMDLHALLRPRSNLLVDERETTFNVFYVPDAEGSPYVPGQEQFVIPFHIKSVLGFGSLLPSGELFATILFSKVPISRDTADLFKTLALYTKIAVLPFDDQAVFGCGASR